MQPNKFNSLKLISDCPVCRRKQFASEMKMIEDQGEMQLMHVVCKFCESCLLVIISMTELGASIIGVLTDLQSQEIKQFLKRGPLTADDAIAVHQLFQEENCVQKIINIS